MILNGNLPMYHSPEYWRSPKWVRDRVNELHRRKKQEDLNARKELARMDPQWYLRVYGCPYYGRL